MASSNPHFYTFLSKEGYSLHGAFYPALQPKADMILLHGLAEYTGRYTDFIHQMNEAGINIYAYDHRGHGKSGGPKAYISSFGEYTDDLKIFINQLNRNGLPLFLMGHSMGSLIAATWLAKENVHAVQGFISSSGALKVSDHISPFLQRISGFLAAIVPALPTIKLEAAAISRDKRIVSAYENDPLVWRKGVKARLGHELLQASKNIQQNFAALSLPMLILHGTADRLADPKGSQMLMEKSSSADKQFILSEGGYHELLNDPGKEEITQQIVDWISKRL